MHMCLCVTCAFRCFVKLVSRYIYIQMEIQYALIYLPSHNILKLNFSSNFYKLSCVHMKKKTAWMKRPSFYWGCSSGLVFYWCGYLSHFSSPHLVQVRERICVNGCPIGKDIFTKYFWQVYSRLEETKVRVYTCYILRTRMSLFPTELLRFWEVNILAGPRFFKRLFES